MFNAVAMCQIRMVVLDRDRRTVLQGLGRLGAMHLMHEAAGPDSAPLPPLDCSEAVERCDQLLHRLAALRGELAGAQPGGLPVDADGSPVDEAENLEAIEAELGRQEAALAALNERLRTLETSRTQLGAVVEQLQSFRDVNLPFESLDEYSFLHFAVGSLPEAQLERLREAVGANVVLLPLPRSATRRALVAVTSRAGRFALETALQQAGFQREAVPATVDSPLATLLAESKRERDRLEQAIREAELARLGLAVSAGPGLAAMERRLVMERQLLEAESSLPRTRQTVLITGWVPAVESEAVDRRIQELTRGRCAVEVIPAERLPAGQVPILLRHSRLLRPFEMLVAGYGLPGYRDIEPTLFVAITYMLMFGLMFGDVGHGAVLALAGLVALARGASRKVKDVGTLLVMVGLSSAGFGFVYGSFFGLARFHRYALWHDPLEGNPIELMLIAVGLGVGVISTGLILNIVNRFRKGDWIGGFLDSYGVAGAIFYWGILGLLLKFTALRERGLVGLTILLVIGVPLLGWSIRGPLLHARSRRAGQGAPAATGGTLTALMESIVEAFEAALSYMANTISFVRLAAYAMSHAAVLIATFVLAREVAKVSSGGGFLSLLVVIGGNLVAIVLEGIIAGVQALRLEYYEFFNKFFAGDGQAFTPFSLARQHGDADRE